MPRREKLLAENEARIQRILGRLMTEKAAHRVRILLSMRLVRAACQHLTIEVVEKMDIKEFKRWCKEYGYSI